MIGLGIDTGGTCTDAVLFDTTQRKVLGTGKTLTTKENLVTGIDNALGKLEEGILDKVKFVSLSTTLATNACVENRGGNARLLMIGHIPKDKAEICRNYGFSDEQNVYFLEGIPDGGFCKGIKPDWEKLERDIEFFKHTDAVAIVQSYPQWNDNAFEKKAADIIGKYTDVPVVCGSNLFSDINSFQRGAGAYLNARLIPVIHDFLKAVKTVLAKRKLNVPIYIMRSDGSLMNEEFAKSHPVETLLCGPAASTMGGIFGHDIEKQLVIDMGGTTTDVAIIDENIPVTVEDGIKINKWKTFVKGLFIDTYGLGGDSCVRYKSGKIYIEPFRVIPVSYMGSLYPSLTQRILDVSVRHLSKTEFYYEGFILQKRLKSEENYTKTEIRICEALKAEPLLINEIGEKLKLQTRALPLKRLEEEGVIMRFGMTPTDIMHIRGDYNPYNTDTVKAAIVCMSNFSGIKKELIPDMVYLEVKNKLYRNLVRVLMEYEVPAYKNGIPDNLREWLGYSCELRDNSVIMPFFKTQYKLVGVGAPTHVFLKDAAEWLGTDYICHEYAATANALGTLVGQVAVKRQLQIEFDSIGYKMWIDGKEIFYEDLYEAEQKAKEYLRKITSETAVRRGAAGGIKFMERCTRDEYFIYGENVVLNVVAEVTAVGNIIPE